MERKSQNSPSPAISKMRSAFFEHLKLPEIYMESRLLNCQLIPGLSDNDCRYL